MKLTKVMVGVLLGLAVLVPQAAADSHRYEEEAGDSYYSDYFEGEGDIGDCFDTDPDDHSNSAMDEICDQLGLSEGDWR